LAGFRWDYQTLICDGRCRIPKTRHRKKSNDIITKKYEEEDIKWVQLFSGKEKQDFYKKLGFEAPESEAPGVSLCL